MLVASLARQHTEKAIQTLFGLMTSPDVESSVRRAAADSILDRGWGKPAQAVLVQGDEDKPLQAMIKVTFVGADADAK